MVKNTFIQKAFKNCKEKLFLNISGLIQLNKDISPLY